MPPSPSSHPFSFGLHDLGRGAFAWLQPDGGYGLSNAGLISDSGECLLVDTLINPPLTQVMLDAMRAAVPAARRIGTVLNTHAHPDHTAGNQLLPEAEIVASAETAAEMRAIESPGNPMRALIKDWQRFGEGGQYLHEVLGRFGLHEAPQRLPTRTFDEALSLQVGNKAVQLLKVGPAHTRGDVVAHVPDDRLVFTGDLLFHQVHPVLLPGHCDGWVEACERLLGWDVDTVVPGHGPITTLAGVRGLKDYLCFFRDAARARFDSGMLWREAARDITLDACRGWADEERILGNVHSLYVDFGAVAEPMVEVFAEAGRYRRWQAATCPTHGPSCSGW